MAPWAKFRTPMMLKRKAKPNATNMYIDDNTSMFTIDATVSSTRVSFLYLALPIQKLEDIGSPFFTEKRASLEFINLHLLY